METYEIIMAALGVCAVLVAVINRTVLRRVPHVSTLLAALGLFVVGWVATVVEGLVLPVVLNHVEHGAYALGAVALATWTIRVVRQDGAW